MPPPQLLYTLATGKLLSMQNRAQIIPLYAFFTVCIHYSAVLFLQAFTSGKRSNSEDVFCLNVWTSVVLGHGLGMIINYQILALEIVSESVVLAMILDKVLFTSSITFLKFSVQYQQLYAVQSVSVCLHLQLLLFHREYCVDSSRGGSRKKYLGGLAWPLITWEATTSRTILCPIVQY